MTGYKHYSSLDEALWSAQMESTRKDVERAFGILKGRFRCLKLPIRFQSKVAVDRTFIACIMLNNMILTADGRDSLWENDVVWNGKDGEHDVNDEEWQFSESKKSILYNRAMKKLADYSFIRKRLIAVSATLEDNDSDKSFYDLRRKLVNNYYYLATYEPHKIEWLN